MSWAMQRYLILIAILVLVSEILTGCAAPQPSPTPTPAPSPTPTPEPRLMEFRELKLTQLGQVNRELTELQVKIEEAEAEVDRLNKLIFGAYERISKQLREQYPDHPGVRPGEPVSMAALTTEEIVAMYTIDAANTKLSRLMEQERQLLTKKQYVERTVEETNQYTELMAYYEFKLSQLNDWNTRLISLKIDIDQGRLLGSGAASAEQEYNLLLVQRQLLQEDIKQLELLLSKD